MFSCLEDIEEVMDIFLDDEGMLPIITAVSEEGSEACKICGQNALYYVSKGRMEQEFQ